MTHLYRLFDPKPNGMFPIPDENDAGMWNDRGWGIFWTVQDFDGPRRTENLRAIRSWVVDIDTGTKGEQQERVLRSPLKPSRVVETRNGYHVYFDAIDASPDNYRRVCSRLVDSFDGDPNARDLARVLRVPGFLHWKDPAHPFPVREIYRAPAHRYTEAQMLGAFPMSKEERRESERHQSTRPIDAGDGDFWDRVFDADQRVLLERLSGRPIVNGERFTFRPVAGGKFNIHVDGKSTSAWISAEGRIGSHSNGGPTVFQWLKWYPGVAGKDAVNEIRAIAPELFDDED